MMDYKGKSLNLQEEKKKWEVERTELMAQISKLKKDQNDEKEIMEELMSQTPIDTNLPLVNIERPLNEFSADALLVPISQVSMKEVEIKELKEVLQLQQFPKILKIFGPSFTLNKLVFFLVSV